MRYLRMLTNAALVGALGATFVTLLVLQLNPQLPLVPPVVAPLFWTLLVFYGPHLAAFFYALIVVRQLFARDVLSPGWLSLRLLTWMAAVVTVVAAALMWLNVDVFRPVLPEDDARRMAAGAAATALCGVLLLIIAIVHYSFGRRGSRVGVTLFVLGVAASVGLPLTARGFGGRPGPAGSPQRAFAVVAAPSVSTRVHLILLDGASLEYIAPATGEGRLPNFGRLLDGGASMHLATMRPTQPGPVWTVVATGKMPPKNGVRSAAAYVFGPAEHPIDLLPDLCFAHALVHFGLLHEQPNRSTTRRARALWSVLSGQGLTIGVVGIPLTDPVEPVRGYLVADRVHLAGPAWLPLQTGGLVYPPNALEAPAPEPGESGDEVISLPALPQVPPGSSSLPGVAPTPRDLFYERVSERLEARFAPQVSAVRLDGIDVAGHHYLRYAMPWAFGDVSEGEEQAFGRLLERQYAWVDGLIGERLAAMRPDDVLMVVSGFGMEPVSVGKRLLARALREPDRSGTHERGPDGFLVAIGGPMRRGRFPVGSIADVTPTILYLLGLPVGRDMDGDARTDLFKPVFTAARPITFIPSYEQ